MNIRLAPAPSIASRTPATLCERSVQNDNITWPQRRDQNLFNIGEEQFAIDRAVEDAGCGHAIAAKSTNDSRCLPVTMRHRIDRPFATWSAAIKPHIRLGPGLINENQLAGAPARLLLTPFGTSFGDIRPVLLGRSEGLFICQLKPAQRLPHQAVARRNLVRLAQPTP